MDSTILKHQTPDNASPGQPPMPVVPPAYQPVILPQDYLEHLQKLKEEYAIPNSALDRFLFKCGNILEKINLALCMCLTSQPYCITPWK
jgi:hypothetical protein